MKKISSAIFLAALIVFINCKSNVATANTENQDDSVTKFYQSIVSLGNGFLDVFKSFGELVADTLGLKADPKKSEVKNYFSTMASKLEATKKGIDGLKVKTPEGDSGKSIKSAVESAVALIEKLIAAAKEVEAAATGTASEAVGTVVKAADDAGAGVADADSVKGIAKGIKAIVEAVGGDAKLTAADAKEDNKDAGKLFTGKKGDNNGGDAKDASKAAGAVSAVSGEQIIKAIVDAAGKDGKDQVGAKASEAKENGNENAGKLFTGKSGADKGGEAKDASKAAGAVSAVSGEQIIKAIVEAVGKADKEGKKAEDAKKNGNEDAGKLFGKSDNGGDAKDASKAAGAVSAVSGEQIIKAIVDAAGKGDKDQVGAKASEATNPIAAAIGTANEDAAAFGDNKMKKDDQIAAAIALRGMAKDGKFAVKDANEADAKGAVKRLVGCWGS
ncbi:variable large family protein (plasmid) [Borreliella afzelii]|uniref:variable large family protein n=1 Tax=Borreliella afzelii TaxID=29518 RepID=UPI003A738B38